MTLTFDSNFVPLAKFRDFDQDTIKYEPMLFSANFRFAVNEGGPITRKFLEQLPSDFVEASDLIIDSRVHMLMPGWYPCIPGWHLDDVPRTRPDGQPNHANPEYKADHVIAIVGDASRTELLKGKVELEDIPEGQGVVYGKWHEEIQDRINRGNRPWSIYILESSRPVLMNWQTFHQGKPATKNGWRFFIRATKNTQRVVTNEVRTQTQIYLPAHMAGW